MAVDEFEFIKPPSALRLEFGQLRFGFFPLGLVLSMLGFELLILLGTLLQGIHSRFQLLVHLGFCRHTLFKLVGEQLLDFGALLHLPLEFPKLNRMPLLPLN